MNNLFKSLLLIILVIITLPIFFITIPILIIMYNGLIRKRNAMKMGLSSVDVMLKRRSDLVPNLVSSVKSIMKHESDLIENVTKLRTQITDVSADSSERFEMENQLSTMLGKLSVSMESYPEIKSNENMMHLQRSLTESEEQISAARRTYNAAVTEYNNAIHTVPSNLIAGATGFTEAELFEATEIERATPQVGKLFE